MNRAGMYKTRQDKTVILQTAQTSDGRWYPTHIQFQQHYTDKQGQQHTQHLDQRIVLQMGCRFVEDILVGKSLLERTLRND